MLFVSILQLAMAANAAKQEGKYCGGAWMVYFVKSHRKQIL